MLTADDHSTGIGSKPTRRCRCGQACVLPPSPPVSDPDRGGAANRSFRNCAACVFSTNNFFSNRLPSLTADRSGTTRQRVQFRRANAVLFRRTSTIALTTLSHAATTSHRTPATPATHTSQLHRFSASSSLTHTGQLHRSPAPSLTRAISAELVHQSLTPVSRTDLQHRQSSHFNSVGDSPESTDSSLSIASHHSQTTDFKVG